MKANVKTLNGEYKYISLPNPIYEKGLAQTYDFTGVKIMELFYGKKTGRFFVHLYSKWDNGKGGCVGDEYHELNESEFLRYCKVVKMEIPDFISAEEV